MFSSRGCGPVFCQVGVARLLSFIHLNLAEVLSLNVLLKCEHKEFM